MSNGSLNLSGYSMSGGYATLPEARLATINFIAERDCLSSTDYSGHTIYYCGFCRTALEYDDVTLEHLIPRRLGAGRARRNLGLSCSSCNQVKGHRVAENINGHYHLGGYGILSEPSEKVYRLECRTLEATSETLRTDSRRGWRYYPWGELASHFDKRGRPLNGFTERQPSSVSYIRSVCATGLGLFSWSVVRRLPSDRWPVPIAMGSAIHASAAINAARNTKL